jgi:hypothetical protein
LRYDIAVYSAFFVTIPYAVGFVMDMAVPTSIDAGFRTSSAEAFIANLVLLSLFTTQYSAIPRSRNSERKYVPRPVGRSTCVLLASLCLMFAILAVASNAGNCSAGRRPQCRGVDCGDLIGWTPAFTSTILIDHFQPFGSHQVTADLASREMPPPQFRTSGAYPCASQTDSERIQKEKMR